MTGKRAGRIIFTLRRWRHSVSSFRNNAELRKGLNIIDGTVVHPAVTADYPIYPYEDVDSFLSRKKQPDFSINGMAKSVAISKQSYA